MNDRKKSFFSKNVIFSLIIGNDKWLSMDALPCPGICLIIGKIPELIKPLHAALPNNVTISGSEENALSPITLWVLELKTSRQGAQLTFIPILLRSFPKRK